MSDTTSTLRRALGATVLAGAVALSVTSCSSQDSNQDKNAASATASSEQASTGASDEGTWPRTVHTADGDLTIESKPQRIVSTSVALTGSLLAVDAPVVASGATGENIDGLSDEHGFFVQWADKANSTDVKKLWGNNAPEVENIVDYDPDLIVVSRAGGDSAYEQIEEIRKIAPVLVVDYTDSSWQDVTKAIGEATGHEKEAKAAIDTFEKRVDEVKNKITVPEGTVSPLIIYPDGSAAGALTDLAPQVQLLKELGFKIADIPEEVKGGTSPKGKKRKDAVHLSLENIQKGLPGDTWIIVAADPKGMDNLKNNKAFSEAHQVKEGKYVTTPRDTFRLDYFSAMSFLDSIEKQFTK